MPLEDAKSQVDTAFTRTSQRGYAFENAFGGATSFLRRSYTKDLSGVDLAITGVPFDQAVTHRAGTRFGPRAIREASTLMPYDPPTGWPTNPLEELNIIDYGDLAFDYAKTQAGNSILGTNDVSNLEALLYQLQPNQFDQARSAGENALPVNSSFADFEVTPNDLSSMFGNNDNIMQAVPSGGKTAFDELVASYAGGGKVCGCK